MNLPLAFQMLTADVNFAIILPELIVAVAGVLVMMLDAFARPSQRWLTGGASLAGLLLAAAASIWMWTTWAGAGVPMTSKGTFNGMIVLDELRLSFTLIVLFVSAVTVLISMVWVEGERLPAGEFHSLLLFATSGMMLISTYCSMGEGRLQAREAHVPDQHHAEDQKGQRQEQEEPGPPASPPELA